MPLPTRTTRSEVERRPGHRRRRGLPDPVTAVAVAATAVFALVGIGSPLLGLTVFADTGSLADYSGYRDVLAGVTVQTGYLRDQVDAALPNSILFGEALRSGEFAAWNPYAMGGAPLAATPNLAIASPLSLPFWFLPGWLAPGYVKLLELICAIGGSYLFLRRLRLSRAASWLGGLVFASSAFMVVWTGWPQTRVAALIPALFWSIERLAQRVRVGEVALVALVVAGLILGGFPAVTGYALVTAAGYLLVRVVAEHRTRWRPILARCAAAVAGLAAGVALTAWQLVPWVQYMASVLVSGRDQDATSHIRPQALLTAIAPYAFGTVSPANPPYWFGDLQLIDAQAYVGAAALVLVLTAVAAAGPARAVLPRGVWWLLIGASAGWTVAIFLGGPLLVLLQHASFLFSGNFIGRARSVLGFLLAVLAAVGFEVLLRRRRAPSTGVPPRARRRLPPWLYPTAVWGSFGSAGVLLYLAGRRVAGHAEADRGAGGAGPDLVGYLTRQLAVGLAVGVVAAACVAWLWWARPAAGRRWPRLIVVAAIPVLVAGQALWWVQAYYPRTQRDNFYPTNPTQAYLAAHLDHQRFYGADGAIFGSVDVIERLRSYHGHSFVQHTYAELAETLPGEQFGVPPTAIGSDPANGAAAVSPVLDRAAVSYYVAPPEVRPFGPVHAETGDGSVVRLDPGRSVTVPIPVTGPVRGLGLMPVGPGSATTSPAHLVVAVRDATGRVVASGDRVDDDVLPGRGWYVPLAAEDVPAGARLTAELTVVGSVPMQVAGLRGRPVVSTVASAPDGLRLVYAKETVIYQRTRALDRAHWATDAVTETDPAARVSLVSSGRLGRDQVVLAAPGPPAEGKPAQVSWIRDGLNEMVLRVNAQGAGYLVLADAIQTGWRVTVDGRPAPLRAADHAFGAVAVPAGEHTVRFFYPAPVRGPGAWITTVSVAGLLLALGVDGLRRRRVSR